LLCHGKEGGVFLVSWQTKTARKVDFDERKRTRVLGDVKERRREKEWRSQRNARNEGFSRLLTRRRARGGESLAEVTLQQPVSLPHAHTQPAHLLVQTALSRPSFHQLTGQNRLVDTPRRLTGCTSRFLKNRSIVHISPLRIALRLQFTLTLGEEGDTFTPLLSLSQS